jgi:hypothetical protein
MTKIITMTELTRNPKGIRELVQKGIKILIKFEGEILMELTLHKEEEIPEKMPTANLGLGSRIITKDDIYDENSWLNNPPQND